MNVEHDYFPVVEGALPVGLQGSLFRNGPGRFERGENRKNHLLDGDGMIQAFDFRDGTVRYRNRFVRTEKYCAEQAAGRLLYPTWTTLAPGGVARNLGANKYKSQAGVTVYEKNGRLYAFDEVGLPYGLDPETLETLGEQQVGPADIKVDYKAHTKTDGHTGEWLLLGVEHGRRMVFHVVVRAADGTMRNHQRVAAPRRAYVHDWFATEHYVMVLLHPVELSLAPFLSGLASLSDSLRWKPHKGNLLMVIDRSGASGPVLLEAPARFMWHSLNAYETGGSIIADFVGYEAPDHFLGENAAFKAIMQGKQGEQNYPGTVRRYVVNLNEKRLTEELISSANHEFPVVHPGRAGYRHRYGYFVTAADSTVFPNGLARIEMDTGRRDVVLLDDETHLGEPVFVPDASQAEERGWLLSVGLNGKTGCSFLGVFRAERLADGPVARVLLGHPTPLSFHGCWHSRSD